jgi:simple sugar transport system permease protein
VRRGGRLAGTIAGLAAGWLVLAVIVWAHGEAPRSVAAQLFEGTWGMPYGIGQVFYKATSLVLTGVAVDLALRAGLFNVGVEGQLAVAGLAVATLG